VTAPTIELIKERRQGMRGGNPTEKCVREIVSRCTSEDCDKHMNYVLK
jgi:hypothetical protein